jgi:uncharacterized membrane protein YhdT
MLGLLWEYKDEVQWAFLLAGVALAVWRGAAPERKIAAILFGMWAVDQLYHAISQRELVLRQTDIAHAIIDSVVFLAMLPVALRANRFYPLWITGLQLLTLISHIVRALSPEVLTGAYAILAFAPSYLITIAFLLGVVAHCRRQWKANRLRS